MRTATIALLVVGALLAVSVGYVAADQVERQRGDRCEQSDRPAACQGSDQVSPERLRAYCRDHPRDARCRA